MDISETIKRIRQSKGLNQSFMAEHLNIALNNYSKIERGITEIGITRLYEIAKILEVSVTELLGEPIQNTDNERVISLEKRIFELEDRLKDKVHIIENFEKADDKIKSDLFGLYIYLRDLEIQLAYSKNIEVVDENVYNNNGKLEEFAVHTYIKNENEWREIIVENFNNPIIEWLIDFLILHDYKDPEVLFWKKCLEEENLKRRAVSLDFTDDFEFPDVKKIITKIKKRKNPLNNL